MHCQNPLIGLHENPLRHKAEVVTIAEIELALHISNVIITYFRNPVKRVSGLSAPRIRADGK
jgi:hypothetical protein